MNYVFLFEIDDDGQIVPEVVTDDRLVDWLIDQSYTYGGSDRVIFKGAFVKNDDGTFTYARPVKR